MTWAGTEVSGCPAVPEVGGTRAPSEPRDCEHQPQLSSVSSLTTTGPLGPRQSSRFPDNLRRRKPQGGVTGLSDKMALGDGIHFSVGKKT